MHGVGRPSASISPGVRICGVHGQRGQLLREVGARAFSGGEQASGCAALPWAGPPPRMASLEPTSSARDLAPRPGGRGPRALVAGLRPGAVPDRQLVGGLRGGFSYVRQGSRGLPCASCEGCARLAPRSGRESARASSRLFVAKKPEFSVVDRPRPKSPIRAPTPRLRRRVPARRRRAGPGSGTACPMWVRQSRPSGRSDPGGWPERQRGRTVNPEKPTVFGSDG